MSAFFTKTDNVSRNTGVAFVIVLIFVAAHALTCYFLHYFHIQDGLFLTCLTIAMVFSLIRFYKVPFDVFLGLAFLSCFAGFYLGTEGAKLLDKWVPQWGLWSNVLMTSFVTAVLGTVIIFLVRKNWNVDKKGHQDTLGV